MQTDVQTGQKLDAHQIGDSGGIKTNEKKDLGIIVDSNLKCVQHINTKVKKANQMLGIIKRTFTFMDK